MRALRLAVNTHAADKMGMREKIQNPIKCTLDYNTKSWSALYKSGHGTGTVTCNNGQTAKVDLRYHGVGVEFGKEKTVNGTGTFSDLKSLDQIYGSYATSSGSAAVAGAATGQVLTKDGISLSMGGTGKGVDLGFNFGDFSIKPVKEQPAVATTPTQTPVQATAPTKTTPIKK